MSLFACGNFNYAQDDILNKYLQASFKFTKIIISGQPSIKTRIHLYYYFIKPKELYCSEILGVFRTNIVQHARKYCISILSDIQEQY